MVIFFIEEKSEELIENVDSIFTRGASTRLFVAQQCSRFSSSLTCLLNDKRFNNGLAQ